MAKASGTLGDAAKDARKATGSTALDALIAGVPGTTTADIATGLKTDWKSGVEGWSDDVSTFATEVGATSTDTDSTDQSNGWFLDLFGIKKGG